MNNNSFSKNVIGIISVLMFPIMCFNCQSKSKVSDSVEAGKDSSSSWYSNHDWLNGLKLTPNESINQEEFARQYHIKSTWWDEAFNFLKTHDPKTLAPGKYVIDSGNVFATVWEGIPKIKDSVLWEAHRDFNDLLYIIDGKAEMGITPIKDTNKKITVPYTKEADIEHFTVDAGDKYYPADSSSFFIFSPEEMHRPAIAIDEGKPIKKIVIKVRVPE